MNHKFQQLFHDSGIISHMSCPQTPQQNGMAERMHRTLLNTVRSMFVYSSSIGMAVLFLYVDDIIITASITALLDDLISSLKKEFRMTDLGALHYFLGIAVQSLPDGLFLCQQKYTSDLLERAGMLSYKSVTMSLPS